jgi:hypothetical protein
MSDHLPPPEGKDSKLWEIAQKRADFKDHLLFYIMANGFFCALWLFTDQTIGDHEFFPWFMWSLFGWGIWLVFDFAEAYIFPRGNSVEREYQKLEKQTINNI